MAQKAWFALSREQSSPTPGDSRAHHFVTAERWEKMVVRPLRLLEQRDPGAFAALAGPALVTRWRTVVAHANALDVFWMTTLCLLHGDRIIAQIYITPLNLTSIDADIRSSLVLGDCDVPTAEEVRFDDVEGIAEGWRRLVDYHKLRK